MAALTLDYGKWELDGMTEIHDVVTCGPVAPSLSAVLAMDDLLEGEAQSARSRQLLAVGKHPMAAFYVVEEQHSSFTTAVSRASTVATKLTSAVFSLARTWWASAPKEEASKTEAEPPKSPETPILLALESYLSDPKRKIGSISLDPTGHLAALSDSLGRVILLDVAHKQMLRMWKGYRDAQCVWLWVEPTPSLSSQTPSALPRPASNSIASMAAISSRSQEGMKNESAFPLFLVIYAPRRGILEAWHMRHGSRVGILEVGVDGRLLSTTHPLGTPKPTKTSRNAQLQAFSTQCFFLATDGHLLEINVLL